MSKPVQLPAGAWTTIPTSAFTASGPQGELCAAMAGTRLGARGGVLVAQRGETLTLEGRLLGDTGALVTLGRPFTLDAGTEHYLCFNQPPDVRGRTFRRVEILPSAPATIQSITWWSGRRSASL